MKIKKVLPSLVKYTLPCALIVPNVLFSEGLPINTDLNTDAAGPLNVTINDTSYEVSGFTSSSSSYSSKLVKSIPGLSLTFDPNEIEDNERAMKLISDVLSRLV